MYIFDNIAKVPHARRHEFGRACPSLLSGPGSLSHPSKRSALQMSFPSPAAAATAAAADPADDDDDIPDSFLCPISCHLMRGEHAPVILDDGYTYSRAFVEEVRVVVLINFTTTLLFS